VAPFSISEGLRPLQPSAPRTVPDGAIRGSSSESQAFQQHGQAGAGCTGHACRQPLWDGVVGRMAGRKARSALARSQHQQI